MSIATTSIIDGPASHLYENHEATESFPPGGTWVLIRQGFLSEAFGLFFPERPLYRHEGNIIRVFVLSISEDMGTRLSGPYGV